MLPAETVEEIIEVLRTVAELAMLPGQFEVDSQRLAPKLNDVAHGGVRRQDPERAEASDLLSRSSEFVDASRRFW